MKKWKTGLIIGVIIGIIGTIITQITGHISFISIPVVILFGSYGLMFVDVTFELLFTVVVYGLFGAIIGYLIDLLVRRNARI